MEPSVEAHRQPLLRTLYYWTLLLGFLFIADDLTFGWLFWVLSTLTHPLASATAALAIYWAAGFWVTLRGLSPNPGRIASWLLHRLQLERKNRELELREESLKQKITSVSIAVPMSLLFGGVVTTLWLRRREVIDDRRAQQVAFWLCGLYACEFAAIHALGIGSLLYWAIR